MQVCKNICINFQGYTKAAKNYYINDIIFCSICNVGFHVSETDNFYCTCCGGRIRNQSWQSKSRQKKKRLAQLYAHAIEVGEEIEQVGR